MQSTVSVEIYDAGGVFVEINRVNSTSLAVLSPYAETQSGSVNVAANSATGSFPTTQLSVAAYCVVQVPIDIAVSVGVQYALIQAGFSASSTVYYRKAHTEQYTIRVPY